MLSLGIAQVPVTAEKRGVTEESLPTRRFRALLHQLGGERGYGWQTDVAEQLGVSRSYISRILNNEGDQNVGRRTLEAAQRALWLNPRFWTADGPDDLDHQDFVTTNASSVLDRPDVPDTPRLAPAKRMALETLAAGGAQGSRQALAAGLPSFQDWQRSSEAESITFGFGSPSYSAEETHQRLTGTGSSARTSTPACPPELQRVSSTRVRTRASQYPSRTTSEASPCSASSPSR